MNKDNERIKFEVLEPLIKMKVIAKKMNTIVIISVMNFDLKLATLAFSYELANFLNISLDASLANLSLLIAFKYFKLLNIEEVHRPIFDVMFDKSLPNLSAFLE